MKRAEFLENHWIRYPSAQINWKSVDDYVENVEGFFCGRLTKFHQGTWSLFSNGASVDFNFSSSCNWQLCNGKAQFAENILILGDIVCLKLQGSTPGSILSAQSCLLLNPAPDSQFKFPAALNGRGRNPGFTVQRSQQWGDFTFAVREFFRSRGFIEATTPTLVVSPGTEPFLEPFSTVFKMGSREEKFFLPTSPEFHLKKMLVAGWTKIFELKSCFRNSEVGVHHQPEFQMLEWYRAYADLNTIADDVENLLIEASRSAGKPVSKAKLERTTISELFKNHFDGFTLKPDTTLQSLRDLAKEINVTVQFDDSWDEVFFRIFIEKIEPRIGLDFPVLVHGYPPSQAALARIGRDGFADRFEVYWRGLEIANAFHELNDPYENERRFVSDLKLKNSRGFTAVPVDEELMTALKLGLPPSGGIALGLDRLFMAIFEIGKIAEARAFPI